MAQARPFKQTSGVLLAGLLVVVGLGAYVTWQHQASADDVCVAVAFVTGCDGGTSNYSLNNLVSAAGNLISDNASQNDLHANVLDQALAQPFSMISYNFMPDRSGTIINGLQFAYYGSAALDSEATIELRTYTASGAPQSGTLIASTDSTAGVDTITLGTPSSTNPVTVAGTLAKPYDMNDGAYTVVFVPKPYESVRLGLTSIKSGRVGAFYFATNGWQKWNDRAINLSVTPVALTPSSFIQKNTYTLGHKSVQQINAIEGQLTTVKQNASSPVYNTVATRFTYSSSMTMSTVNIAVPPTTPFGAIIAEPNLLQAKMYLIPSNQASDALPVTNNQVWSGNLTLANTAPAGMVQYTMQLPKNLHLQNGKVYSLVLTAVGSTDGTQLTMSVAPTSSAQEVPFFYKDSTDEKTFTWMTDDNAVNPITVQ